MKVLKLHPLMTISLLQMQIERLLSCNVAVYVRHSLANNFDTLRDAGFEEETLVEFPIDETLSLREFEEEMEERFNFSLELCSKDNKPFRNKSQHLFQLSATCDKKEFQDIPPEMLNAFNNRQFPQQNIW
ncbi:hypothetical protein SAMN05660909_02798 [Chitinophaga terrae (ex Kim and Jung 2007)]|jgi:hypothetical protein|uniref:Uncharacterized protein n=1 Tax=Chitinophaga terrae (ex Kim and Jung 2007) TaxID=408074 RepID=A0A1H4CTS0_9BACT|nr:hypothetical protein [Chitinophaga terrae (ex Kim and Jung 2007)]MDQ0105280.1 hypothetical protein [Chitinophaga terrae (ex Kim and Jung 2007)]GEP90463.1 hypothetical protein CTE07_21080 [Chitinophaga terrae (ex Kim and Jung 2007)]SEA63767.1 hypothetical protein SAMN05660909_02798 [Chitinophaga terrae (ex Kim and Jung 2007)]